MKQHIRSIRLIIIHCFGMPVNLKLTMYWFFNYHISFKTRRRSKEEQSDNRGEEEIIEHPMYECITTLR